MTAAKRGGLGRGLDALFADVPTTAPTGADGREAGGRDGSQAQGDRVRYIDIHEIMPNTNQTRKVFSEEKIGELAASIEANGIIQPLVVRQRETGYEIVAGERRWRAARAAGLKEVPCLVRELTDEQHMLLTIIENMQREDLNPIEEAEGLQRMVTAYGLTQEQISKSIGKSRPYITNALRLLKLPEEMQAAVANGDLSAGHGRALLAVTDKRAQRDLCDRILREGLSVRETEKLAAAGGRPKRRKAAAHTKDPDTARVEDDLQRILGTRVRITESGDRGRIEIDCYGREELNRLIELLQKLA